MTSIFVFRLFPKNFPSTFCCVVLAPQKGRIRFLREYARRLDQWYVVRNSLFARKSRNILSSAKIMVKKRRSHQKLFTFCVLMLKSFRSKGSLVHSCIRYSRFGAYFWRPFFLSNGICTHKAASSGNYAHIFLAKTHSCAGNTVSFKSDNHTLFFFHLFSLWNNMYPSWLSA